jgi:hypothetical protein
VKWVPYAIEGQPTNFVPNGNDDSKGGGDAIFPETPTPDPTAMENPYVWVQVSIAPAIPQPFTATIHLKMFDPDHFSSDTTYDTNDAQQANKPDDNVQLSPGSSWVEKTLSFDSNGPFTKKVLVQITQPNPGNNFISVAVGRKERLDAVKFADDGMTLLRAGGVDPLPPRFQTKLLTVWRTLHVEEDSLGPPTAFDSFDGPGENGDDDVNPGDLGTGDANSPGTTLGPFAQPSLNWLKQEMRKTCVKVVSVEAPRYDPRDNAAFVRNVMEDMIIGNAKNIRDLTTRSDRWVVQVFAAYEQELTQSFDPNEGIAILGNTKGTGDAGVVIFLETIRDVSANVAGSKPPETIAQRVVLHEVMHRFGHGAHDVGPMIAENNRKGSDFENELGGSLLREIMVSNGPK